MGRERVKRRGEREETERGRKWWGKERKRERKVKGREREMKGQEEGSREEGEGKERKRRRGCRQEKEDRQDFC